MNTRSNDDNYSNDEPSLVGKLGGEEIFLPATPHRPYPLRSHFWATTRPLKGYFLILPGFTEFCEKYALTARRLVQQGYSCLIIDWPGQGRSAIWAVCLSWCIARILTSIWKRWHYCWRKLDFWINALCARAFYGRLFCLGLPIFTAAR